MDLDRGVLAKIDRQLLAGLRHDRPHAWSVFQSPMRCGRLGSAIAPLSASRWVMALPNSSDTNSWSRPPSKTSQEPSSTKSNPDCCRDLMNLTAGRGSSTDESKTFASQRSSSERGLCRINRRGPNQVATTAAHADQGSSTSDATAPSSLAQRPLLVKCRCVRDCRLPDGRLD